MLKLLHKLGMPKKYVICRLGMCVLILSHALLLIGELVTHEPTCRACKRMGYGALFLMVICRAMKPKVAKKLRNRKARAISTIADAEPEMEPPTDASTQAIALDSNGFPNETA